MDFCLLAPKNAMLRISYTGMTTVEKGCGSGGKRDIESGRLKNIYCGVLLPQTNVSKLTMEDKSLSRSEGWKKREISI